MNPMRVAFMKAQLVDKEVPDRFGLAPLRDAKLHVFDHPHEEDWDAIVFSDGDLSDFELPLQVLLECTFGQDGLVVIDADWVVYETLPHDLSPPTLWALNRMEDAADEEPDQSSSMPLWAQFAWLMAGWEKVGHDPAAQPFKCERPKSADLSVMPPNKDSGCAGLSFEDVMSQLEVRRQSLQDRPRPIIFGSAVSASTPSQKLCPCRWLNPHF